MHAPQRMSPPLCHPRPPCRCSREARAARAFCKQGIHLSPLLALYSTFDFPTPSTHLPLSSSSPLARACGHHAVKILSRLGCCWRTADHQTAFSWRVRFPFCTHGPATSSLPRLGWGCPLLPLAGSVGRTVGEGEEGSVHQRGRSGGERNHCTHHPPAPAILSNNTRN